MARTTRLFLASWSGWSASTHPSKLRCCPWVCCESWEKYCRRTPAETHTKTELWISSATSLAQLPSLLPGGRWRRMRPNYEKRGLLAAASRAVILPHRPDQGSLPTRLCIEDPAGPARCLNTNVALLIAWQSLKGSPLQNSSNLRNITFHIPSVSENVFHYGSNIPKKLEKQFTIIIVGFYSYQSFFVLHFLKRFLWFSNLNHITSASKQPWLPIQKPCLRRSVRSLLRWPLEACRSVEVSWIWLVDRYPVDCCL